MVAATAATPGLYLPQLSSNNPFHQPIPDLEFLPQANGSPAAAVCTACSCFTAWQQHPAAHWANRCARGSWEGGGVLQHDPWLDGLLMAESRNLDSWVPGDCGVGQCINSCTLPLALHPPTPSPILLHVLPAACVDTVALHKRWCPCLSLCAEP